MERVPGKNLKGDLADSKSVTLERDQSDFPVLVPQGILSFVFFFLPSTSDKTVAVVASMLTSEAAAIVNMLAVTSSSSSSVVFERHLLESKP